MEMVAVYLRPRRKIDEIFSNLIKNGNPDPRLLRQMIMHGANVNARDNYSNTALHVVMRYCINNLQVVRVVLNAGANPNSVNVVQKTPLRMAIKYFQDIPVLSELIKFGANVNFLDRKNNTALHFAVMNERHYVIDFLLQHKADVNIKNNNGNSVLHLCVFKNDMQTLKKILQCKDCKVDVDVINNEGETPLMCAVKEDNLEIVKELLLVGASVKIADKHTSTPLHAALRKSSPNLELLGELVRYNADIFCYDEKELSPLHLALNKYAEQSDNLIIAKTLLKYDALQNVDHTDWCKHNIGKYDVLPELLKFYGMCLAEVNEMKSELIHKNFSFLEFVIQGLNNRALFEKRTVYRTFTINQILHISKGYPIYRDIIATRLERKNMRKKIMDVVVYTKEGQEERKVILDHDSIFTLSSYLSNLDMLNLIEAFSDLQAPYQDFGFLTLSCRKSKRKHED